MELLRLLFGGHLGIVLRQFEVEFFLYEPCYLLELGGGGAGVEQVEVAEGFGLEFEQEAGEHFFVDDGGVFHPVGHYVVDVFDKDDVGTLLVEVLDEGSVSARTEDEFAVVVADGVVLLVYSDDVGVVFLFGEGYV